MRVEVPRPGAASSPSRRANSAVTRGAASTVAGAALAGRSGAELAAGVEIGEYQRRDLVALGARQHHVANKRREMRDQCGAQRPDADPGAGRELEVLGEPAVEQQAFGGSSGSANFSASPIL